MTETRIVARFSCGAASAVATKIAIERYGNRVEVVNAYLAAESEDNRRFLADCERWFGRTVTVLRDTKYGAEPANVWTAERFIAGRKGAPCSRALKGRILDAYAAPDAGIPLVLGYTAEEAHRLDNFLDANATATVIAPLIDEGITKDECLARVRAAGLVLPLPYRQGFDNSNCLKCPRGGVAYWLHIDHHYPENFEQVAQIQDVLGPSSYFLSDRRDGKRVRISLRTLKENPDPRWLRMRIQDEPPVSCGGTCELTDPADTGDGELPVKQPDLISSPTPSRPVDHAERDMFGNPITPTGEPAPTYRPRKPVQQTLDLEPGTFKLT